MLLRELFEEKLNLSYGSVFQLNELIEPRKPNGEIVQSKENKYGWDYVYRTYHTSLGNKVDVEFKEVTDESVDVTFYVNDSLEDDASVVDKDVEISTGVLYILMQYLNEHTEITHCSFLAASGKGDIKTKYNLPTEELLKQIKEAVEKLLQILTSRQVRNDMKARNLGYSELLGELSKLSQIDDKISVAAFTKIANTIGLHSSGITSMPEYQTLVKLIREFITVLKSHTPSGAQVMRNRRAAIYGKLMKRYFSSGWDINVKGNVFDITRKGTLNELTEPSQPKGEVTTLNHKQSGYEYTSRKFVTSLGHDIKVTFKWLGADSVDAMFSVDGSIDDREGPKDPELLPGVLWVLLQFLNENHINYCTFFAMPGKGDRKIKYNLSTDKLLKNINTFSTTLLQKIDTFEYKDDVHPTFLNTLSKMSTLDSSVSIDEVNTIIRIYRGYGSDVEEFPEHAKLEELLIKLLQALKSHSPQGVEIIRNRRAELYTKMVEHYFANDWDIDIIGMNFGLTRKGI